LITFLCPFKESNQLAGLPPAPKSGAHGAPYKTNRQSNKASLAELAANGKNCHTIICFLLGELPCR